jgi:hypothetical protein
MKNLSGRVNICAAVLGVLFALPAAADDSGLTFQGGIGVIPVSAVTGCPAVNPCPTGTGVAVTRNIVRGVQPPGQIWVINELEAKVSTNGSITVNGQGLVLGGGDNAGRTPAPALSVFASLFCGPATSPTESDTNLAGVTLSPTGDFQINDTLAPVPATPCVSPMLLIRNAGTGNAWFAVGIPGSGHHH